MSAVVHKTFYPPVNKRFLYFCLTYSVISLAIIFYTADILATIIIVSVAPAFLFIRWYSYKKTTYQLDKNKLLIKRPFQKPQEIPYTSIYKIKAIDIKKSGSFLNSLKLKKYLEVYYNKFEMEPVFVQNPEILKQKLELLSKSP